MLNRNISTLHLILAALLGAATGGILVILATRAIPKMMSGMMQNMMTRMKQQGCSPTEI